MAGGDVSLAFPSAVQRSPFSASLPLVTRQPSPLVACVSRAGLLPESGLEQSRVWGDGTGPCWPGKGSGSWARSRQGGKYPWEILAVGYVVIDLCCADSTFWKAFFLTFEPICCLFSALFSMAVLTDRPTWCQVPGDVTKIPWSILQRSWRGAVAVWVCL